MKPSDWLNILKESRHGILLLCISNAFFIFMAWVAYPETFRILVVMMVVFSIVIIVLGILIIEKKQKKYEKVFYDFIRKPTLNNENELIGLIGKSHKTKVNYLANKLRHLNDELEKSKLQTTDYEEFIESWVHEIKAPISLITLVLENRKNEMSELVYQRLEHARINIKEDVEQILFYARLQASHVDYRLNRILLSHIIEDVLFEIQALLDEKEVKVISQVEDIPIVTDEKAFQFVLGQIFVNGIQYSNEKVDSTIWIKTSFDNVTKRYYLQIDDNGLGVLNSDLPFIFDKGVTGDNPNSKQSTGIGLYLVKKLCDELKIEIEVASEYGKGFTIQFFFPIIEKRYVSST